MCGFIAVFQRGAPLDGRVFKNALDTLSHRGPDYTGFLIDSVNADTGEVYAGLGHCRLAIVDLDARSNQPFTEEDCHLVYNGEIYNFRDLKNKYEYKLPYRTDSDTEFLHRVVRQHGDKFFDDLNGMWSFCFFDKLKNIAIKYNVSYTNIQYIRSYRSWNK